MDGGGETAFSQGSLAPRWRETEAASRLARAGARASALEGDRFTHVGMSPQLHP